MPETMLSPEQEPSLEITHRRDTSRIPSPDPDVSFLSMHDSSFRNLFLGFFCVFVSILLFAGAWVLLGAQSLLALATAILVLFLLASLWAFGVHRQRGGLFLSFGLVTIVGALVPLLMGVVLSLPAGRDYFARLKAESSGGPLVSTGTGTSNAVRVSPALNQAPLLTDAYGILPSSQGDQIRVLVDSMAVVDGRMFLIRAGQMLPLHGRNSGGLEVRAADFVVTLPNDRAEVVSPMVVATSAAVSAQASQASPPAVPDSKEQIRKSTEEAVRRFPALAIRDSDENRTFVDAYNDLKEHDPKFLDDPNWPLKLAEQMGAAYAWTDVTQPAKARALQALDPSSIDLQMGEQPVASDTQYLDESINAAEGRRASSDPNALPALPLTLPGSAADGELPDAPPLEIKP